MLVDTGASYSIYPHSSAAEPKGPPLRSPGGQAIPCWGEKQLEISFAGQKFVWTFLLAKVDFAILGADFLKHFHLVVDLPASQLLDTRTLRRFAAGPPAGHRRRPAGAFSPQWRQRRRPLGRSSASSRIWPTLRAGCRLPSTRHCTTSRRRGRPPQPGFAALTGQASGGKGGFCEAGERRDY